MRRISGRQGEQLAARTEAGPFKLGMWLYIPKKQVADGTWQPPAVQWTN